jgi:hypothetical protein
MKIFSVFFLLINLFLYSHNNTKLNISGFRSSDWGNSISEITSKEVAARIDSFTVQNFTILAYKDIIADKNTEIYYGFENNKLLFGIYKFIDDHTNDTKGYFKDYEKIKNIISSQYTLPVKDEWITENNKEELYKENDKLAESALVLGLLELKSSWALKGGNIILSLKQENGIYIKVTYLSESFLTKFDLMKIPYIDRNSK